MNIIVATSANTVFVVRFAHPNRFQAASQTPETLGEIGGLKNEQFKVR